MINGRVSLLLFTNAAVRAGAEEHMLMLARGVDPKLFKVHIVCPPELMDTLRADVPSDVELIPLDLSRPTQLANMIRFARILRNRRVDILHSHMFSSSLLACPIGWLSRVPIIVETTHVREAWRTGWFKGSYFVDRLIGRCVDHYIAVSRANAVYLTEQKGLPSEKVRVIFHAADLRRFNQVHRAPEGLKASVGIGDDEPLLVFPGRLEPQKGHSVLFRALVLVRKEFPNVRVACLGEGSLRKELEEQVQSLGLQESVRFLGYRRDVEDWLAVADFALLPSFYEGLPGTAIEALACERTLVATAVDGTPEVVIDGKTGLTVPPGEPVPLANAICRLIRDPGLRQEMARNGRQWVMDNFTFEHLVRRTQAFYLEAWDRWLGPRTQPSPIVYRTDPHKG